MTLLERTIRLYALSERSQAFRYPLEHGDFESFSLTLNELLRSLGEEAQGDFWKPLTDALRNFRYLASATPLPFGHSSFMNKEDKLRLQKRFELCLRYSPASQDKLLALQTLLERLLVSADNPYLAKLETLVPAHNARSWKLLIKNTRLKGAVQQTLWEHPALAGLEVIDTRSLCDTKPFKGLIVCGSSLWFPHHVLDAPRAEQTHVMHYRWLRDQERRTATFDTLHDNNFLPKTIRVFAEPRPQQNTLQKEAPQELEPQASTPSITLPPEVILPTVDWAKLTGSQTQRSANSSENVEAYLYLLEDDHAVYLKADDDASVTAFDPSTRDAERLRAQHLESGMFVLLRTEGADDYVVEIANSLMGEHAAAARQLQAAWKKRVRDMKWRHSVEHMCHLLKRYGSTKANPANLQNWVAERTIGPKDVKDLNAIMMLIDWYEKRDEVWQTMTAIRNAHKRAGGYIREQLLKQLKDARIVELDKTGRLDITLPNTTAGKLSLFRVLAKAPEKVSVAYYHTSKPFSLEEHWL
jgi:hypothetical protein